jgi:vancomycin resistance protein YoaR
MHRRFLAVALGALVLVYGAAVVGERAAFAGQVLPGVRLPGVKVAGLGQDSARHAIAAQARWLERRPLALVAAGRRERLHPGSVGLRVNDEATTRAVLAAGRDGNPLDQAVGPVRRRLDPVQVSWRLSYDARRLDRLLAGLAEDVDEAPRNGDLRFAGARVERVPPRPGILLDRAASRRLIAAALGDRPSGPLELPVRRTEPPVNQPDVNAAAAAAQRLLAAPPRVKAGTTTLTLPPERLATALRAQPRGSALVLAIDPGALRAAFGRPLAKLERPPRDARFALGPMVRIVPDRAGRVLDAEGVARQILSGRRPVTATFRQAQAEVTAARLRRLGIKEQVSTFTTPFPRGEPRVKNIQRAAAILQDRLIKPGEEFSLNQAIGPRTRRRGFVEAPIILEGEFETGVGGGVSQIATTFFNAIFRGGYKILEFQPHSYWISRYPKGVEATLSIPDPDLRFVNDTGAHILVRTKVRADSVTITLYGDNQGRRVEIETHLSNQRPAGVETVTDPEDVADPHDGFDVEFLRTVTQPGRKPIRERYFHRYDVGNARVLAGGRS